MRCCCSAPLVPLLFDDRLLFHIRIAITQTDLSMKLLARWRHFRFVCTFLSAVDLCMAAAYMLADYSYADSTISAVELCIAMQLHIDESECIIIMHYFAVRV